MGGVAVVGVEHVCDFCTRVLFLIPVQLRGACVVCSVQCVRRGSFVVGLLFSTHVMGGVAVVGVVRVCDFCVQVLFLIPVQLWGGVWGGW